jgi:hypothetical protein
MGKTDLKYCSECQDWQFVEWLNLAEKDEEPEFAYTCISCGSTHPAEPPIKFKSKELPKGQMTL